ncbi:MAG: CHAP domain-containing protein [Clostridiales bacterium]|nr:CHAP domain-containing protein [Clostridiales bacterium]
MKRLICWLAFLCLLLPASALADALPESLLMQPGESQSFSLPFTGYWESDAPEIASAESNIITAHEEGEAILAFVSLNGDQEMLVHVIVQPVDPVPASIRAAINIAIKEWEELDEKKIPQDPKGNKFTKWWKYACGWCGAFASYCLDQAGVPLEPTDTYRKVKPVGNGEPHGIREAAVPKLYTGFENMERITAIPRPGYLIIYGAKGYYDFVHVAMVTDVVDRGNGVYQLFTVEGNMNSTVKRYSFLYDSQAENKYKNLILLPEEEWLEPDIYHYDEPRRTRSDGKYYNWYVYTFCQTWY